MVTLCMVCGPLFQCATRVMTIDHMLVNSTTLNIAQVLPDVYFRAHSHKYLSDMDWPGDVRLVAINTSTRAPVKLNHTGSSGQCETKVNVRLPSIASSAPLA
jgi:transcriptional regulator of aromatic amino acid metabolism